MAANAPRDMRIYWFSGTGNAESVASWILEEAAGRGIPATLVRIAALKSRKNLARPAEELIGFCGPTHGFNFPPILLHFIFRFPRGRNQQVILVNTRAGMKMGRVFTPGLSGMALYLSALVLLLKGYRIQGMRSIDLHGLIQPGIRHHRTLRCPHLCHPGRRARRARELSCAIPRQDR